MRIFTIFIFCAMLLIGCTPAGNSAPSNLTKPATVQETGSPTSAPGAEPSATHRPPTGAASRPTPLNTTSPATDKPPTPDRGSLADVLAVQVSGEPGSYTFAVTIASPDTGCEQYADWWEVLDEDGNLLYRRVLLHSHPGEQPFTRFGGPVTVEARQVLWVRAHMQPDGYGGTVQRGSVESGFSPAQPPPGFAVGLETSPPQPDDCAF